MIKKNEHFIDIKKILQKNSINVDRIYLKNHYFEIRFNEKDYEIIANKIKKLLN